MFCLDDFLEAVLVADLEEVEAGFLVEVEDCEDVLEDLSFEPEDLSFELEDFFFELGGLAVVVVLLEDLEFSFEEETEDLGLLLVGFAFSVVFLDGVLACADDFFGAEVVVAGFTVDVAGFGTGAVAVAVDAVADFVCMLSVLACPKARVTVSPRR